MEKFDTFIEMLKEQKPFCLVRFNDGEMMGVYGPGCVVARKDQPVNQELTNALREALGFQARNYWIGMPCPNCFPPHRELAEKFVPDDYEYRTMAVVLTNDNWPRAKEEIIPTFGDRPVWVISGEDQNWDDLLPNGPTRHVKIPSRDSWSHYDKVNGLWKEAPEGAVVLISCGPLSRVLAFRWWRYRQDCTLLDVGSTFDPFTRGVKHKCHRWPNGRNRGKFCPVCNTKGRIDPNQVFDRSIDYETYKAIYDVEVLDEENYPREEEPIREALKSCFYGVRQKKRNKKISHCWTEEHQPSGKGLELAFGFGTSLKWLTSRYDVVMDGIDFSEYMQTLVPYFREDMGDKLGELWKGDVAKIDKPDEHYDFINSCSVFEHLPDIVYYDCLKECYRILKPGGLMAVFLDGGPAHGEHLRMDSPEQTKKDMVAAGFEPVTDYLFKKV